MAVSSEFTDYVKELMAPLGPVTVRRMFGGAGIFADGLMIALIAGDVLYLKADDQSRAAFEAEGCFPFTYEARNGKRAVMSYWQAPERLFDEPDDFAAWARDALSAALRADAAKPASKRKART